MYNPKFGLSVSYYRDEPPAAFVSRLKRFDFTTIEINLPYIEKHRSEIGLFERELETLTCHLRHGGEYVALSRNPSDDARILELHEKDMALAASIGCRTFVFHLGNVGGQKIEDYWDRSVAFARALGDMARRFDSVVGVENCLPVVGRAEVARKFLAAVDHDNLGMTLDTGHFWSILEEDEFGRYKDNPLKCTPQGVQLLNTMCTDMARAVNTKIFNIHIHNLRPDDWKDHQPVDRGIMKYEEFFRILREIEYDRTVMVELRPTGDWNGFESSAAYLRQFA